MLLDLSRSVRDRGKATATLCVMGLVAIVLVFGYLLRLDRDVVLSDAARLAREQSLVLADHVTRLLEGADLALAILDDEADDMGWDQVAGAADLHERARRLKSRLGHLEALWLYDADGRLRLTTLSFPPPPLSVSDQEFFRALSPPGTRALHVGVPAGESGARPTLRLSRRLDWPDGSFRGVGSVTLELDRFAATFSEIAHAGGTQPGLLRTGDLRPLAGTAPADDGPLRAALAQAPEEGSFLSGHGGDGESMLAYRRVTGYPLTVTVSLPMTELRARWLSRIWDRALGALLAMAALALLGGMAIRQSMRQQAFQTELESRVAQRTAELERARLKLETLLHEVHHRVRNNLQVIGSLLLLQQARLTEPEAARALHQAITRVQAISIIHGELYADPDLAAIPVGDTVRDLASQLGELTGTTGRVAVTVTGDNPRLPMETLIPLALTVNEVLSGLLSHGFPDDRGGAVAVSMERDGDHWLLCITGGESQAACGTDALGQEIVGALAGQLRASHSFATGERCRFTLRFAAPPPSSFEDSA